MGEKTVMNTEKAAALGGPYPQAVVYGGLVFVSGQGAVDPVSNQVTQGTIEQETLMALENLRIILEEAGSSLEKVLQVTVYLLHMKEYGRFNEVYRRHFKGDLPARTCVQAGSLPFGLRVEIDAIAHI
ncbi:MAG: RidA family protein [Deltaproteobacteria bacterium]|nr:RidA family protein [Deltaproteobacteria bacterium]MBW2136027.1 RidA family protein [Deltaproteobacteria bacterium]